MMLKIYALVQVLMSLGPSKMSPRNSGRGNFASPARTYPKWRAAWGFSRSFIPVVAALALSFSPIQPAQAAAFTISSPLTMQREFHTATLLSDGRVLVVGGGIIFADTTAELYDP